MEDRVLMAWGIFLALAYVLTLSVLPILFGVIRAANRIARDSDRTLPGALGIARNTKCLADLKTTETVGGQILNTAQTLVAGADSIAGRLRGVA